MTILRSILVPLDGSAFAEQALPLATDLARSAGAILQFALAHHPQPALTYAVEAPILEDQNVDEEQRSRETEYLTTVSRRVTNARNLPVSALVLDGPPAVAIAEQVERSSTDLVVMTTHGRGPLSRFWIGSVADELLRTLTVPLILVRPREPKSITTPIRRILVALDRSRFSTQVLEPAMAVARCTGASLTLLTVVEPSLPVVEPVSGAGAVWNPELDEEIRVETAQELEQLAARLEASGLTVSSMAALGASAAQGILEQAEAGGFDLIAITTHGAGGARRLLLGSVADKVVRGSTRPVLVLRGSGQ